MKKWLKESSLDSCGGDRKEKWIFQDGASDVREEYDVSLTIGKKTDLLSLKTGVLGDLKRQVEEFRRTRTELYAPGNQVKVEACPVCAAGSSLSDKKVVIYGAQYNQCRECSHVYVINRPSKKAIEEFYLSSENYASTYTDKAAMDFRINQIAVPFVEWTKKVYSEQFGKYPGSVLDIGAGSGHFVFACRESGMEAQGVELSEHSRKFASKHLDVELDGGDFVEGADKYKGVDVVTFWGLLEHTPNPLRLMEAAASVLENNPDALVIAKFPRWYSISAAIQRILSDSVIRHLDPLGHIMCFTDASAATLYRSAGFLPVSAWYYGMDVYELFMQMGLKLDNMDILTGAGDVVIELQEFVDQTCFSDGIVLAGVLDNR